MYLGDNQIYKMFFGDNEIFKGFIGDTEIFGAAGPQPVGNNWVQFRHNDEGTRPTTISLRWKGSESYYTESLPMSLEYCVSATDPDENTEWTQWTSTGSDTAHTFGSIDVGMSLYVRSGEFTQSRFGRFDPLYGDEYWRFQFVGGTIGADTFTVSGNLSALFDKDANPNDFSFSENYACTHMFASREGTASVSSNLLVDAENLVIPRDGSTLAYEGVYAYMFYGQAGLQRAPQMFRSAEQAGFDYGAKVYEGMFQLCQSLSYDCLPEIIIANYIGDEAFAYMYYGGAGDGGRTIYVEINGAIGTAAFDHMFYGLAGFITLDIHLNSGVNVDYVMFRGLLENCSNVREVVFRTNGATLGSAGAFANWLDNTARSTTGTLLTDDIYWWDEVVDSGYIPGNWTIQPI